VEPKNRLKPFLEHVQAFTEAQREVVPRIIDYFDAFKAWHEAECRKPHKDRLIDLVDEARAEREDEINEALRTGDEEALKAIRADMIRLVLNAKP
jgi:hypothetical protein